MNLTKAHVLLIAIIMLTGTFLVSLILQFDVVANTSRSLILPLATVLYYIKVKNRSFYFSAFLVLFSLSEFIGLWENNMDITVMFFIGNTLYIIGYILLILDILHNIRASKNYKRFFTKYALHIAVMLVLNAYIIILLGDIVKPHLEIFEYAMSMVYNTIILLLLSAALLNFFCNDTRKSLILFLASMCIVFSEILQLAYYYLTETIGLNIIYSLLLVLAFYLFYKQGFIKKEANNSLHMFRN